MPRPHRTALMRVGTVIEEHDGTTYKKTVESRRDPFPWVAGDGGEYGDERMAHLLDDGAQVVEEHSCRNCEGVDPASCPFDTKGDGRD
ncbi:hypothetical protein [Micromonospora sp. NPDC050695]|uniref:hypothetical protein n=1 Tax=Micromonospora sp. NPDC050695 TaxID=3154938 RepID=UPI0033D1ED4A